MNITSNKKGFTLVELIAAVTIMAILGSIVVVSFKTLNANRKEKEYNEYKRQLEDAACTYIDLDDNKAYCDSGYCSVYASQLIQSGLISDELYNPKTKAVVSSSEFVEVDNYTNCTYYDYD